MIKSMAVFSKKSVIKMSMILFGILLTTPGKADQVVANTSIGMRGPDTPLSLAVDKKELPWLQSTRANQHIVLETLYKASFSLIPKHPRGSNTSPAWLAGRYKDVPSEEVALGLLYEDLIEAHRLLVSHNIATRVEGLHLAYHAIFLATSQISDNALVVRINDAFLLPYINLAYTVAWREVSQPRILENAIAAYQKSGQNDKAEKALRFLIAHPSNAQEADWARIKLAESLAGHGRYTQAISELKSVQSDDMRGSQSEIAKYTEHLPIPKPKTRKLRN